MSEFILLLLFGACWTWGVYCVFAEGYIMWFLNKNLEQTAFPNWAAKPLYRCPPCMSSIHGFAISAAYFDFHIYPMMAYMVCLCGLNFIIKSILYPEYE